MNINLMAKKAEDMYAIPQSGKGIDIIFMFQDFLEVHLII